MVSALSDHGHTHEGIEEHSGLDYLWRVGDGRSVPPPAPGLEGQDDQGFNPESLEPDPESEPMFLHRSTPSVAEAAGPFPAAVRIRRVENVRHAHQCLHAAGEAAIIAVVDFLVPNRFVMTNHDIHVLFRDF
jgi:hypothetical protein